MRRALVGLIMAATAITPIASAAAQDAGRWRGRGGDAQAQGQTQAESPQRNWRAERQSGSEARVQQRSENRGQRFENRTQGEARTQRFERRAPQVDTQQQVRTPREFNRQRGSDTSRADAGTRFQRREAPSQVVESTRQVQNHEGTRDGRQWDRNRTGGTRMTQRQDWDGNRVANRNWDGNRNGRWDNDRSSNWTGTRTRDGDRNWSGTRSGSRDGSSYRWNRNGRMFSWNSDWRHDRRYDWQDYRRYNRAVFNVGRYYSPYRNYGYQRFSIGFFLQPLFYSSNYWIGDPWEYRLPPAPPGTRWVRYYDDVLLVDMYTGEVVDVIYDFFW